LLALKLSDVHTKADEAAFAGDALFNAQPAVTRQFLFHRSLGVMVMPHAAFDPSFLIADGFRILAALHAFPDYVVKTRSREE